MKKQIAHFFWHGKITLYEYACIGSFVKNNFEVNVWSYDNLKLPTGAINKNAAEILPKEMLFNFEMPRGNAGSLAAFSDVFRLTVIKEKGGWWFDTDCVCLKSQDEFVKLTNDVDIVAGWEDNKTVNNAVIFMSRDLIEKCLGKLKKLCLKNKNIFEWGESGPLLITELVKENNLNSKILPPEKFYPLYFKYAIDALDPSMTLKIESLTKNSFVYHYWSEVFNRKKINKMELPHKDSYLFKYLEPYYFEFLENQ
jgi:hypothetical protein